MLIHIVNIAEIFSVLLTYKHFNDKYEPSGIL